MDALDELVLGQIDLALMEDIGGGDITTLACVKDDISFAKIVAKSEGIIAGLPIVKAVFSKLDKDARILSQKQDGERFLKGDCVAEIRARRRAILTGERTALNYLGHLSGIATLTSKFVAKVSGTGATILDTRKTHPGLRHLEKYAVACGGGENHRFGLYDMILIKDNHIASCGSIKAAMKQVREFIKRPEFKKKFLVSPSEVEIEIEVADKDQLKEAIDCGVKRIMLDNQSISGLRELVKLARSLSDNLKLEASGNVNLENVAGIAETGVDYISIGALTHSAPASDFSLEILVANDQS
jgi:nicotinate-nucleotide pyrophosphorylase (carboxylating)